MEEQNKPVDEKSPEHPAVEMPARSMKRAGDDDFVTREKAFLRVLHLETVQDDVRRVRRQLQRAGYRLQHDLACSPGEFVRALRAHPYDLVLSDYSLPGWTALDAFDIARREYRDMPFIVLARSLGEDLAVECIKRGVTDYVAKERIGRLPFAVERAVKDKRARDAERLTRLLKEVAEQANRFKDQFLSGVSHELRTPLNAVIGFSELLTQNRHGSLSAKQSEYVRNIHTAGRSLLKLINDLVDLSKIEAGRLEFSPEALPLDLIAGDVVSSLKPQAEKKNITLTSAVPGRLRVRADAQRLQQVLANLVDNAVKFTPEGGQIAVVASEVAAESGSTIRVEVVDNGPGIARDRQEAVLAPFYRGPSGGHSGSGLGLALAKSLVEAQGGKFGLESEEGHGSRFFFSLPAAKGESQILRMPSDPNYRGTVLVVEDDQASAQLIESQLAPEGYHVYWCDDPSRAVRMAAQLQPTAITLDLLMKPISGWEVLGLLKKDRFTLKIPVIMVSVMHEREVGALLGASDYLVKPVERDTLLQALERCRTARPQNGPLKVLVVDDDPAVRETIRALLEDSNYQVAAVTTGLEAQAAVAASLPSVVILDLLMPGVDGFELLERWRADPHTANLPVLVLSGKDLADAEREVLTRLADGVFSKSRTWNQPLLEVLQQLVARDRRQVAVG